MPILGQVPQGGEKTATGRRPGRRVDKEFLSIALLVALGVVLHRLEALLPLPSPWVKLGLANIMTLVALVFLGMRAAFLVAFLRVALGSIFGGTFLSPAFFLSFAGGLSAAAVMALVYMNGKSPFSMMGVCLAGACAHMAAVFFSVQFFLALPNAFYALLPFFFSVALFSGYLTGTIANNLIGRFRREGVSLS